MGKERRYFDFYGFENVEMPDGKDAIKQWNENGKFIEKRVRAKR